MNLSGDAIEETGRYIDSCGKEFWKRVFERELAYLVSHLDGCRDILSVGCGPGSIEGGLVAQGFSVTGLDVSWEVLRRVPKEVGTVAGRAEDMPFSEDSFDAVIYVASLQFIEDYRRALEKTALVLRPKGRVIVMLLNPESDFFKSKAGDPDSYFCRIRHRDSREIEKTVGMEFSIRTEYFLWVSGETIVDSTDATQAVLYIINGNAEVHSNI